MAYELYLNKTVEKETNKNPFLEEKNCGSLVEEKKPKADASG